MQIDSKLHPFKGLPRRKKSFAKIIKENYVGYLFILPVIIGLTLFTIWPMINSLYYSFWPKYSLTGPRGEIDFLYNYIKLFGDENVWKSLRITFVFTLISLPLSMILSFFVAVMVNWKLRGIGVFRLLYYLPVVIPVTISGLLWRDILNPTWGIANSFLTALGLPPSAMLNDPNAALPIVIGMGLFGLGGGMVLWLSALKNVPQSLYESAKIDGANRFRMLLSVTLPMCTPIIFYNLIMGIIGSLQTFASIMTLVGSTGGRDGSLLFYVMYIYSTFYGAGSQVGYASAMSWILFIIVGILSLIVFKTSKWVYYGGGDK